MRGTDALFFSLSLTGRLIDYFQCPARGILPPDPIPHAVLAEFLATTPRLDKRLIGAYISEPSKVPLLRSFLASFDFQGVRSRLDFPKFLPRSIIIYDELRAVFARRPVEETSGRGAAAYARELPPARRSAADRAADIKSADDAFVLAFSVVMLNTDLHNRQIRVRDHFFFESLSVTSICR
ncbi:MAG: hypothetical protein BJ554DRAFT_865 [Olpidium bornovanus]|uniref:SEC7 domain-containing protein n=1 Tax=Olpidium bornovanus TaxID=278681 RepID=A0A8H7ZTD8_9FUNG|nr:MAG: hypothetical protein BJ554DRAFT_865 [Olpidium bornovanus]